MIELIREAIALYNLPFTALLGVVLLYWLLVMVGSLDFDFDLFDFGSGDGGVGEVGDLPGGHGGGALGGAMLSAGRLFGLTQVPIAIWGSFFILFMWIGSMLLNYRFNGAAGDRDLSTAAMLLIPNLIGSVVLTRLVTFPVGRFFGALSQVDDEVMKIEGHTGVVTTVELDERYGQVQVNQSGAPSLVNARLRESAPALHKGDLVRVLQPSHDGSFYYVEPLSPPPA